MLGRNIELKMAVEKWEPLRNKLRKSCYNRINERAWLKIWGKNERLLRAHSYPILTRGLKRSDW